MGLRLYRWLLRLLLPLVLLRLAWRGFRNRGYWRRWGERFGFVVWPQGAPTLWLHAVSVGEARAAAPLVEALQREYPSHRLFITTMTPTGSEQVRRLFGDAVGHAYVPYDLPSAVARFLARVRPRLALVMETELWPNLFHACGARGIPLVIANVRLSQASMRGYRRIAGLARATLAQVSAFGAQSRADTERLHALGAPPERVQVTGSIKFELRLPASLREAGEVLRRALGADRRVWIAASTHAGEEEQVLAAHRRLRARFDDALLVLVPRHPERFAPVARLTRRAGFRSRLRSEQGGTLGADVEVLVGDSMGELMLFFAASDVAFVGGSLVPVGGHNILEPAALGVPVITGPHTFNFTEIVRLARERGALLEASDGASLAQTLEALFANPNRRFEVGEAGARLVEENRGALERTLAVLRPFLG